MAKLRLDSQIRGQADKIRLDYHRSVGSPQSEDVFVFFWDVLLVSFVLIRSRFILFCLRGVFILRFFFAVVFCMARFSFVLSLGLVQCCAFVLCLLPETRKSSYTHRKTQREFFVSFGRTRGSPSSIGGSRRTHFGSILDVLLVMFLRCSTYLQVSGEYF